MISTAIHLFIDAWPAGWMKAIMDVDRNPKPAFFAYRNAFQPLMVHVRTDRYQFFEGDDINLEVWIANDLPVVQPKVKLRYQWELNGQPVSAGSITANIKSNEAVFQGIINLKAPIVKSRQQYALRTSLVDGSGKAISENLKTFDIFPTPAKLNNKVALFGNGPADEIATDLQLTKTDATPAVSSGTILINSYAEYKSKKTEIDAAIERGALCLFFDLPPGTYQIVTDTIVVERTGFGGYYFASPRTNSAVTATLKDRDIFFWFDKKAGYVTPFLDALLKEPKGWKSVVGSGQSSWSGNFGYANAASEKMFGKGMVRICQIKLAGRMKENPAAFLLAQKLIESR
jgi:hypothetical protein